MSSVTDIQLDPDEAKDLCAEIAPVGTFLLRLHSGSAYIVGSSGANPNTDGMPFSGSGEPTTVVVSSPDSLWVKNTSNVSSATVRVFHCR